MGKRKEIDAFYYNNYLREIRIQYGFTQRELAEFLEIKNATLQNWEYCKRTLSEEKFTEFFKKLKEIK